MYTLPVWWNKLKILTQTLFKSVARPVSHWTHFASVTTWVMICTWWTDLTELYIWGEFVRFSTLNFSTGTLIEGIFSVIWLTYIIILSLQNTKISRLDILANFYLFSSFPPYLMSCVHKLQTVNITSGCICDCIWTFTLFILNWLYRTRGLTSHS